jgi:hypothetical protein
MSVGDVKGYRRRLKQMRNAGHAPKRSGLSVAASIDRNRRIALSMARVAKKK